MASLKHVVVLNSGGLRSLVATASVLNRTPRCRLTLLHIADGRAASPRRLEHVRQQADHYGLRHLEVIDLPGLYGGPAHQQADGLPKATLGIERLLLRAVAFAVDHAAAELVWPVAVDGNPAQIAAAHQRRLWVSDAADVATTGRGRALELTLPWAAYTDRQVVELGARWGVPWETAWSCIGNQERACGMCPCCHRRSTAFRVAGVTDTASHQTLAAAR